MAKISVYVDDETWARFRESVFKKHGSLRMLSREVEGSLRSSLVEEAALPYLDRLRSRLKPKSGTRPRLRGPPAEKLVRGMRRALKGKRLLRLVEGRRRRK